MHDADLGAGKSMVYQHLTSTTTKAACVRSARGVRDTCSGPHAKPLQAVWGQSSSWSTGWLQGCVADPCRGVRWADLTYDFIKGGAAKADVGGEREAEGASALRGALLVRDAAAAPARRCLVRVGGAAILAVTDAVSV